MNDIQQRIAQIIRQADGDHTMGAAELAEVLVSELNLMQRIGTYCGTPVVITTWEDKDGFVG